MPRTRSSQDVFRAIADPTRRAILDRLRAGPANAGALAADFRQTRPAISKHLRVLREAGFTTVRADGTRRLYSVERAPLAEAEDWLAAFHRYWTPKLDALGTELARGRRAARTRTDTKD